jgi:hypothetical protein
MAESGSVTNSTLCLDPDFRPGDKYPAIRQHWVSGCCNPRAVPWQRFEKPQSVFSRFQLTSRRSRAWNPTG